MFESIISRITNFARNTIRAIGVATRKTPWLVPVAIIAFFLVVL